MVGERISQHRNRDDVSPSLVKRLSSFREHVSGKAEGFSFFARSSVPAFILHLPSGGFVDANESFSSRFSYPRQQLLDGSVRAGELIGRGGRDLLKIARRFPDLIPDERIVVKCTDRSEHTFLGEVSIRVSEVEGERLLYGSVEDVSDRVHAEQELQDQLDAAIQSNKQVRTLMDRMQNITGVTSELLTVRHEVGVLTKAKSILCEREGMNFEDVTLYMINDSSDAVEQPFADEADDPIPLSEPHPAVKVVTGESDFERVEPDELCFPLRGSDDRFGAMTIRLRPDERKLMEADQHVWKGYRETLSILANLIGLIIHNCRLAERERQASIHDSLTGLYNRRYFNKTLQQEAKRAKRYGNPLSLMIIDVDDFKEINDSYGHQEGDRIIQQVARTLEHGSRESDILCRFGGDEFAVVLPSTKGDDAEQLALRIQEQFEQSTFSVNPPDEQVKNISLRVSIGIGTRSGKEGEAGEDDNGEIDETDLLKVADRCMFQAKASDGTRIQQADSSDPSDETD